MCTLALTQDFSHRVTDPIYFSFAGLLTASIFNIKEKKGRNGKSDARVTGK